MPLFLISISLTGLPSLDNHLKFTVQDKLCFEIPLTEVANAIVSAKNEVTVEFPPNEPSEKKLDSLVEIRFFIPNDASNITEDVDDEIIEESQVFGIFICIFNFLAIL